MSILTENKTSEALARYRTLFNLKEKQLNGQKNRRQHLIRRRAMEQLEATGFPDRKDENYKYTNVRKITKQAYREGKKATIGEKTVKSVAFENLEAYEIVLVNGILDKNLSKISNLEKGLNINNTISAFENKRAGSLIEEALSSELGANAFVALNTAFADNGIFIHITKNAVVNKPIHISNITISETEAFFTSPQVLVIAEANSQVNIIETYHSINNGTYFTNAVSRFIAKANAHIHHYKLQNESENAFQINNTIVTQERDASYSSYAIDLGGKIVRNNLSVILKATNTHTNLYGVYLANGDQHIDNQTFIDHAFPHCESNELYKGIIDDRARAVFNGKVNVRPDAQKTNAFQQNSSLVLSDKAVMNAKPQLEIFADDVRCSHGATIGQLDEGLIYYLRTRGMSLEQAKSLLQFAFLDEVLLHFKLENVRTKAESLVSEKLKKA